MIYKNNAYKYDCPIPLNGKIPVIKDWQKLSKTKMSEEDKDFLTENYPDKNIGIVLGESSGIIALDIDDVKNIDWAPPSPIVKVGAKGETRFFKYNGERSIKRHDLGFEILSNGNQTVMPPSIHPDTKQPYRFTQFFCNWDELPILDKSFVDKISNEPKPFNKKISTGRNNTLTSFVTAKIADGKDEETIIQEIVEYDNKNHTPPLFTDPSENKGRVDAYTNAKRFYNSVAKSVLENPNFKINKPVKFEIIEPDKKIIEIDDYKRTKLPKFRGIAQDIFKHIYNNSPIPRTRFAVASTLATLGTALSNRVSCNGIYTNLYLVITTISGGGKDYPLRFPYEAFSSACCKDLIGGTPESDTGILINLDKQTTRLDVYDEASRLFGTMNDKNNLYASKMADIYAALYSAPGYHFPGKTLKNGKVGECHSPCVSIIAALTIEDFRKHFNHDLISKGIGARFMFFPDIEYKDFNDSPKNEIPQDILEFISDMRNAISRKTISFSKNVEHYKLPISDSLKVKFKTITNEFRRKGLKDEQLTSVYNRFGENMMKLAIIDSISMERDEMTQDSLDWAYSWMNAYANSVDRFLAQNIFSSRQDAIMTQLESFIRASGGGGRSKSDILRSSVFKKYNLQSKDAKIYLDTLIDSEKVFKSEIATEGRSKTLFYHSDYVQK